MVKIWSLKRRISGDTEEIYLMDHGQLNIFELELQIIDDLIPKHRQVVHDVEKPRLVILVLGLLEHLGLECVQHPLLDLHLHLLLVDELSTLLGLPGEDPQLDSGYDDLD